MKKIILIISVFLILISGCVEKEEINMVEESNYAPQVSETSESSSNEEQKDYLVESTIELPQLLPACDGAPTGVQLISREQLGKIFPDVLKKNNMGADLIKDLQIKFILEEKYPDPGLPNYKIYGGGIGLNGYSISITKYETIEEAKEKYERNKNSAINNNRNSLVDGAPNVGDERLFYSMDKIYLTSLFLTWRMKDTIVRLSTNGVYAGGGDEEIHNFKYLAIILQNNMCS